MLRFLFISLLVASLSCDLFLNEQELFVEEVNCEEIEFLVVVENMPVLQGGLTGLYSSLVYPEAAKRAGIEGRVTVQFIVNEQGRVVCPKVIRGIGGGCDEAAIDAVLQARFTPGMSGGRPVPIQYSLPIVFRLPN